MDIGHLFEIHSCRHQINKTKSIKKKRTHTEIRMIYSRFWWRNNKKQIAEAAGIGSHIETCDETFWNEFDPWIQRHVECICSTQNLSDNLPIIFAMTKRIVRATFYTNIFFCLFISDWNRNVWHFCNICVWEILKVHTSALMGCWRHDQKKKNKTKELLLSSIRAKNLPTVSSFQNVNKNISTLWCGERARAVHCSEMHARRVPKHCILFIGWLCIVVT